ncbi:MAG: hypothetical protein IJ615_09875 [Bacteroidaceae bacterium]|nr:hypothetical protein [Bacteroidaceae bacterium]
MAIPATQNETDEQPSDSFSFRHREKSFPARQQFPGHVRQNNFSGLEIYFKALEIYFRATEIYFQATEKVFIRGEENLLTCREEFDVVSERIC